MNNRRVPKKKSADNIDRTSLSNPIFTEDDWRDFNRGIELFNAGNFWHAHEAWEQVWRRHHEDSRLFIQGLIQMAAAYHLMIEKRRYSGAISNFNKALRNLRLFEPTFFNLSVAEYVRAIERAKEEIRRLQNGEVTQIDQTLLPVISFPKENARD